MQTTCTNRSYYHLSFIINITLTRIFSVSLIGAAEGYLEEVDKISNKNSSKKDAEQEGVAVANELIKFAGEKLVQVYKGDDMMMKIVEKILMGEC